MALTQFTCTQHIPATLDEVWAFISSPKNLQAITPDYMAFQIKNESLPEKMYPGMIISYTIKPLLRVKMNWVTEITHVREKEYFVDEQRQGPYALWHHEHFIRPASGGVEMTDIVSYLPPFGFLGRLANQLFLKRQVRQIFTYRTKVLEEIFNHK